jgi:hypothetical protein
VPVPQVQGGLTSAQLAAGAVAPAAVSSTGSILGADGAPVSGGGWKTPVAPNGSSKLIWPGDSYGVATTVSSPSRRMSSLTAAALGLTEQNISVAGVVLERIWDQQIGSNVLTAGDTIGMMCGFNNVVWRGTDEATLSNYLTSLVGTLAWLGLPDSKKKFTQVNSTTLNTADFTFTGGWVPSVNGKGSAAQSRCGAQTVETNATAQCTVTGDTVYVFTTAQHPWRSKCYISIDGARVGSSGVSNIVPAATMPDGGQQPQIVVHRFSGLSSGNHTVKITTTENSAYTNFPGVAGFNAADVDLTRLLIAGPPLMTATGYTQGAGGSPQGSPTAARLYQQQTMRAVEALKNDGLFLRYVDVDAAIKVSDDMISGDFIHALDLWHALAASAFISAAKTGRPWF